MRTIIPFLFVGMALTGVCFAQGVEFKAGEVSSTFHLELKVGEVSSTFGKELKVGEICSSFGVAQD